jgi:hypothetical protein
VPLPAPAGGSEQPDRAFCRRPRRGGVVLSRDEDASGLNRWPGPSLLASQVSTTRTTSQGSTPRARRRTARGVGALGARGLGVRGLGAHGLRVRGHGARGQRTAGTDWQAHRSRVTCDVAARGRPATTVRMCPVLDAFFSKILNRKFVDLTTLYNFYKGRLVFFSTDFAQTAVKL